LPGFFPFVGKGVDSGAEGLQCLRAQDENGYLLYYIIKKIQNSNNKCKTTWDIIRKLTHILNFKKVKYIHK
jgi:hypothetical protein